METLLCICLIFSFLLIFYKLILQNRVQLKKNLPPSPPKLPILGHFHLLKKPLHHALHNLSNQYGPAMFLWFGWRPVLVVSTPSAIEECFTKNDIIFANRPMLASKRKVEYDFTTVGSAPYGHHWRNLRRLTTVEVFSSTRIQMSSTIRTSEIRFLTKQLFTEGPQKVELKSFFYKLSFNIMMQMISGNRYFEGDELDSDRARHKFDDIKQTFSPTVTMAVGDFFPFLRWLNFLDAKRKRVQRKRDVFMQGLIDIHRNNWPSSSPLTEGGKRQTLIDVMLQLQESEPELYTDDITKGIIQIMLIAGTETSAMTMEAAGSFLISHPDVFKKARDEIDANVEQSRLLNDGDLAKLAYLHCIINETLRLGPTIPLIPPRESSEECKMGSFNIPCGTMLMVNTWALHRDPKVWEDPAIFKPERFEGMELEKGGFKFIPFGSGRRQCPGASLAMRLMALSLGTLIQCFDWENVEEHCEGAEAGPDMPKDKPMQITFRPRIAFTSALSQL